MKLLATSAFVATALAAAAAPTVSDVTMKQASSRTVEVKYTLNEDAVVTLDVLTNATDDVWVSIGGQNVSRVWGDGNRLVKGAGEHTLYWAPEKSWKTQFPDTYAVKALVKAWAVDAPPDYMAVDLTTPKTVRYYETAGQVPGGVTNDLYKTDVLLMRKIPAKGVEWRMGSPSDEVGRQTDSWETQETTHYVTLTNDYYIGVYELTRRQSVRLGKGSGTGVAEEHWKKPIGGDTGSGYVVYANMRGHKKLWPADGHEIDSDCALAKLRTISGLDFDLPTDAQWEFACRAGVSAALYTGKELTSKDGVNTVLDAIAWYTKNSGNTIHEVGLLEPNGFGLYDMLGNVAEFVLDRVQLNLGSDSVIEPVGPSTGEGNGTYRILRGGAATKDAYFERSAFRQNWVNIWSAFGDCGFRLWAPAVAK